MSMGNSPADRDWHVEQLRAKADTDRAGRLAGRKPLVERLLDLVKRIVHGVAGRDL